MADEHRQRRFSDNNRVNFYSANSDTARARIMLGTEQELVQYRQESYIRIWYNDLPVNYDTHWHTALEIISPVEGGYTVTIRDTKYELSPGDIIMIPPGELHSIQAPKEGERFVFLFDLSSFGSLRGFSGIQSILASPQHIKRSTYPNIYDDVYQILIRMRNEYFNKNEFSELSIYALLLNLFVKLGTNHLNNINMFPNMRVYKQKEYTDKFTSVMDYIDSHYTEDLNLDDIADSIGFSKYHFSRLFKQYTGYTFCAYITHRRIKVAEELLEQPELSITEIALQSGFPSISTFNRVFKQMKNCTPSEYREKNNYYTHKHSN